MWLAIDIGGTKTLLAVFTKDGQLKERIKFPTPKDFSDWGDMVRQTLEQLEHKEFDLCAVASPGDIDFEKGIGLAYGNLPWVNVPIGDTLKSILHCPILIQNDAKLAALSEARALGRDNYHKVLYVTISTGIGGGVIIDGIIDPDFVDTEIGQMLFERNGVMEKWEHFASGSAIVRRFNKLASEIHDPSVWKIITHDIAIGMIDVLAVIQPDIVIIGGGVGSHFDKFGPMLIKELKSYEMPLVHIPPIVKAKNPEEAVIYGCYEIAKDFTRRP